MKVCRKCGSLNWDKSHACEVCSNDTFASLDNNRNLRSVFLLAYSQRPAVFHSFEALCSVIKDIDTEIVSDRMLMAAVASTIQYLRWQDGFFDEGYARNDLLSGRRPFPQPVVTEVIDAFHAISVLSCYGSDGLCSEYAKFRTTYDNQSNDLTRSLANTHSSPEKRYRQAVDCIARNMIGPAASLLDADADSYVPSALLLAHLYYVGCPPVSKERERSNHLWDEISAYIPVDSWKQNGLDYDAARFYSESVAYFLAHGEHESDSDSLFMASKMWIKKGCLAQAVIALKMSAEIGSKKAEFFLNQLQSYDETEVLRHAFNDESPIE